MSSAALREKLQGYIRIADEKKLKAIYNLLENEIEDAGEWWQDKNFVKELDNRYEKWLKGKEKAYSIEETTPYIGRLRKERTKK
jgi:hypothetical protein